MTIVDDFGPELVHDLTREPFVGEDGYGQPTYGAPQALKARTDMQGFLYNTSRGVEVEGRGASYFAPVGAGSRDRFTVHTGDVVQNLRVWTIDDDKGVPYATELLFG